MTNVMALVAAVLMPVAAALAQGAETGPTELARTQRELQQNRTEVDRLIDLRLRHDLGLPGQEDERQFRSAGTVTTAGMEQLWQEQRDQDAATATLLERYNKLRTAVDQLRAEATERAAHEVRDRTFVSVPQAGVAQPSPLRLPNDVSTAVVGAAGTAAAAAPVSSPPIVPPVAALQHDPLRGQIHGSEDHQCVARALFKAGQALMDRAAIAREQGEADAARELDAEAKERLQRAQDELEPLLQAKEPAYEALFYQGRCRELMFRFSVRYDGLSLARSTRDWQQREQNVREPFLAIAARDVKKTGARQEIEVLGPWGMAAQTAMEHFRWMNQHGDYSPRATIEALTWPGERAQ